MIALILQFLGSGAVGSVIGSFFALLNRKEERLAQAEKFKHEQAVLALQNQQALAVADKQRELVGEAGKQAVYKAEVDAFVASQVAGNQKPDSHFAEILMAAIRPFITLYLLVVATVIAVCVGRLVGGLESFDSSKLLTLYAGVIDQVFFLLNLAVSWFFGARGSSQRGLLVKSKKS